MNKQTTLVWIYVYLVVINLLDFITTKLLINKQGYDVEANQLLLKWMESADSTYPILIAKSIPLLLFAIALWLIIKREPRHITKLIGVTCIMNFGFTMIVGASTYTYFLI